MIRASDEVKNVCIASTANAEKSYIQLNILATRPHGVEPRVVHFIFWHPKTRRKQFPVSTEYAIPDARYSCLA